MQSFATCAKYNTAFKLLKLLLGISMLTLAMADISI